jgi:hypothetical protein
VVELGVLSSKGLAGGACSYGTVRSREKAGNKGYTSVEKEVRGRG